MKELHKKFDELQSRFGSKELNSVYGYGCTCMPKVALVFMNPTKRNIATSKEWHGLKAQWLGTKQIWDFLTKCGLFDTNINEEIKNKKPLDWTPEFCKYVYDEVIKNGLWITNLAKCTQDDARPLPDNIFIEYKDLLMEELRLIKPQKVFLFGNQVASIVLKQEITVSTSRQKKFYINIDNNQIECYAIYYPVGNGRFNQAKAIEDIKQILSN